jgi:hypothetical protein
MARFEVEILVSVGVFPVYFGGHCLLFPDDRNIQKGVTLSNSVSMVNWMEGLKLLGSWGNSVTTLDHEANHKCVISILETQ